MSGAEKEFRAALDAANQRHVAACMAQGGFARIVALPGGGVTHLGPDGRPWRHIPDGRPGPQPRGRALASPDPVLERQQPLVQGRVMLDGVRYSPGRVMAMQLLAHGGQASVTVRSLAQAMDMGENAVGGLVNAMIGDGLVTRVGSFAGRPRTALYSITDQGRQALNRLMTIIEPGPNGLPVLQQREMRVLDLVGAGSMVLTKIADAIELKPKSARKVLSAMADRRLLSRLDRKQFGRWKATSRGRKALVAARSGA